MDLILWSFDDVQEFRDCLLYTSDAADELLCVELCGKRDQQEKTPEA